MNTSESIKKIDYWALAFSLLYLFGAVAIIEEIVHPGVTNPFANYLLNLGVRVSAVFRFVLLLTVVSVFIRFVVKKRLSRVAYHLLLGLIGVLCVLIWFDLWWGSTFYYGEVRDKQGLCFPLGSAAWLFYIVWRVKMPTRFDMPSIRIFIIFIIWLLVWLLWELVYEPWNLYQT